jgi:uncharacterized protein YbjT (DUF2867 family)
MIVLMGASGNVGSETAKILLKNNMRVRVIGRHAERLRPLAELGADTAIGDVLDSEFLQQAFEGAGAAFVMTPPRNDAENMRSYSRYVGDSVIAALSVSTITHVVHLSRHGAHLMEGTGPVKGLHDQEQRLNAIPGINVLHLRPSYFMENLLVFIPMIKQSGIMGSAIKADLPFALIATRDVAPVAAEALTKRNFVGVQIRELLGERDVTLHDTARVFGALIGKADLPYVTFTYDDMREGLRRTGFSENAAKEMAELAKAINTRLICVSQPRNSLNTTPTSIEAFAPTFAAVYHAT